MSGWERYGYTAEGYTRPSTYLFGCGAILFGLLVLIAVIATVVGAMQP